MPVPPRAFVATGASSGSAQRAWSEGNRLFRDGRYSDAFWAYTDAIRLDPLRSDFYHNRAVTKAILADPDGALQDLWRAIELEPVSPETRRLARLLGKERLAGRPPEPREPVGREEDPATGELERYSMPPLRESGSLVPETTPPLPDLFDPLSSPPVEELRSILKCD